MNNSERAYAEFADDELILRDYLAADRTVLANERTFLAYLRTALGVLVAGVSFIQFFSAMAIHLLGWALCAASLVLACVGARRYRRVRGSLHHLRIGRSLRLDRTPEATRPRDSETSEGQA
ncbi:MAG: YidH family protein [Armatimonadota bacterium]